MGNVDAASNDPIFLNHHCFVDSIFEDWLQKYGDAVEQYKPDNSAAEMYKGHRLGDYIVPFIPLHTHEEMFKTANSLGYTYEREPDSSTEPTDPTQPTQQTQPTQRPTQSEPDAGTCHTAITGKCIVGVWSCLLAAAIVLLHS